MVAMYYDDVLADRNSKCEDENRLFYGRLNPLLHRGTSTSSSLLLLDLNTIPTDDSDPQTPFDSKIPRKPGCFKRLRVTAGYEIKNPRNPNSKSEDDITSSKFCSLLDAAVSTFAYGRLNPLLHERASTSTSSSSLLLLDLNTIPTDDSDSQNPFDSKIPQKSRCFKRLRVPAGYEMKIPRNPNSQSDKASRKRCAMEQGKPSGGSKKIKVDPLLSWRGRETPESIRQILRDMNVAEQEPKLIFEGILFKTDVNLSMPISQLICNDFLSPPEAAIIRHDINNDIKLGVGAFLVNQHAQRWRGLLKPCESKTSWSYSLTRGWKDFAEVNGLGEGMGISVWTFRFRGLLCFAIVPLPTY